MSAPSQTPGAPAPGAYQGPAATPPAPTHTGSTTTGQAGTGTTGPMSNQNLNQIVTDYLLKRGFNRTEEVFRQESKHLGPDGKPIYQLANLGPKKYQKAFGLLREWVENNLDIYKFELSKLLWPVFVYSFLELITHAYTEDAKAFLRDIGPNFQPVHADDLKTLGTITLAQHINENPMTKLYRENKYRIPLNRHQVSHQ
jgi:transcription initiation factor TFIID subunit 5